MGASVRAKRWSLTLAAIVVLGGWVWPASGADEKSQPEQDRGPLRERAEPLDPRDHQIGQRIDDLSFETLEGDATRLSQVMGRRGLVAVIRSVGCPLCKRYGPTLSRLAQDVRKRGFGFLLINPTEQDSAEDMRAEVEAFDLRGTYVADRSQALARALGAQSTTDAFVLDKALTLVYRGAVNDQYGLGYAQEAPRRRYVREAVEALVAQQSPEVEATSAPGCRLDLEVPPPADTSVTWHGGVSRIIQRNCQECHRPGGSAPFSLMSYRDAKGHRDMVSFMVDQRAMPPWFAGPGSLPFSSDRSLSDRDRSDLLAWIEAGCPEGDQSLAPLPRQWTRGWSIGKPDVIFSPSRPLRVPAEGVVPYRRVTVETRLREDRWLSALEVQPTAPEVVHHVLVFIRYPKKHPRAREQRNPKGGLESYFAAMVPGQSHIIYPSGMARFLPAGAQLHFQIHYTPNGRATRDQPRLGLIFAKGPPRYEVKSQGIYERDFEIPPHAPNHEVRASYRFPRAGRILAFMPHMHVRGKAFRYELQRADGSRERLLEVPRYDFNWQLAYRLRQPIEVAAGERILATAWYDNSADNPANPDPSVAVRFGDQTWDEMMVGYFDWHPLD